MPTACAPTPNLSVFSGTLASGRWTTIPISSTRAHAAKCTIAAGRDEASAGPNRNHDEHHFKALQHDCLESRQPRNPVEVCLVPTLGVVKARLLLRKRLGLVVQRDDPTGPENGLAQPTQAKQQQQESR